MTIAVTISVLLNVFLCYSLFQVVGELENALDAAEQLASENYMLRQKPAWKRRGYYGARTRMERN